MKKTTDELLKVLKSKKEYSDFFSEEKHELIFKSVAEYLNFLLEEKKITKAEVIKNSNLDRTYAYQLFSGRRENPSRNKMLMLAIGMHLNFDETQKLLKVSELAQLYVRMPRDSVIIHCLEKGLSLDDTNLYLDKHGLDILE